MYELYEYEHVVLWNYESNLDYMYKHKMLTMFKYSFPRCSQYED